VPRCAACGQPVEDEREEALCPTCCAPLGRTFATTVTATAEPVERGYDRAPRLRPGQLFAGRYAIVGIIGRGGMGAVYRADDLRLKQPVALKLLQSTSDLPIHSERLANEVRLARDVSHPNVCRMYDIGSHGGIDYLSMEFVDGQTLTALLRRPGGVAPAAARDVARQICAGLAAAHERGVLHRDIKPGNIMIDAAGNARILDFGLAISVGTEAEHRAGTPAYMAPEQVRGEALSMRSDVYALGVVLYEMFAGERLYKCASIGERLRLGDARRLPDDALADVDVTMQAAIRWCLEIDPANRPASAVEVAAMLRGAGARPIAAGRIPTPELILASVDRGALTSSNSLLIAGAALVALLLVGGSINNLHRLNGALPNSPRTLIERVRATLKRASLPEPPERDSAYWFQPDPGRARADPAQPRAVTFVYRQSSSSLIPGNLLRRVTQADPPPGQPGMTMVLLDADGRLLHFDTADLPLRAVDHAPVVEWSAWFAAAGLNPGDFTAAPDDRSIPAPHDRQFAWRGHGVADGLAVTATSLGGRPTFFSAGDHVTIDAEAISVWTTHRTSFMEAFFSTLIIVVFVGAGIVAIRHLRRGVGHLQAANRAAAFVAVAGIAAGLLRAHHVASVVDEFQFTLGMAGWCLMWAAFTWVSYLALEPAIRRHAPHTLVAWTRLFAGRFTDPAIGREVLIGVWGGLIAVALAAMRFRLYPARSADMVLYVALESLQSRRHFVFAHLFGLADGIETAMAAAFLLALMRLVASNVGLSACLVALVATPLTIGGFPISAADALLALAVTMSNAVVFVRAGLLALTTTYIVERLLVRFPVTLSSSAWYFPESAITLSMVAAVVVYGASVTCFASTLPASAAARRPAAAPTSSRSS
jgi:serine/threonine-protein kinase